MSNPRHNIDSPPPAISERYQVDSWVDFASEFSSEHLPSLNKHLAGRSFLAGGAFSLADIAVYFACASAVASDGTLAGKQLDLARW